MNDLEDRLSRLGTAEPPGLAESTVAGDLERAHRSLARTRRRRSSIAAMSVSALAAASFGGYALASRSAHAHGTVSDARPGGSAARHLTLVDYQGDQLPGFTVAQVPEGYVLQGADGGVLDIAEAGDTTSLDDFEHKLVITLEDRSEVGEPQGAPVTVNGHAGAIRTTDDGVTHLDYVDGGRVVDVQSWGNIALTDDQLVQFAQGITVTSAAEVSHG